MDLGGQNCERMIIFRRVCGALPKVAQRSPQ